MLEFTRALALCAEYRPPLKMVPCLRMIRLHLAEKGTLNTDGRLAPPRQPRYHFASLLADTLASSLIFSSRRADASLLDGRCFCAFIYSPDSSSTAAFTGIEKYTIDRRCRYRYIGV